MQQAVGPVDVIAAIALRGLGDGAGEQQHGLVRLPESRRRRRGDGQRAVELRGEGGDRVGDEVQVGGQLGELCRERAGGARVLAIDDEHAPQRLQARLAQRGVGRLLVRRRGRQPEIQVPGGEQPRAFVAHDRELLLVALLQGVERVQLDRLARARPPCGRRPRERSGSAPRPTPCRPAIR